MVKCFLWYCKYPHILVHWKSKNMVPNWKQKTGARETRRWQAEEDGEFWYQTNVGLNPYPAVWSLWSYLTSNSAPVSPSIKQGPTKVSTWRGYYKNSMIYIRLLSPMPCHIVKVFLNDSYYPWRDVTNWLVSLFLLKIILKQRLTYQKWKRVLI